MLNLPFISPQPAPTEPSAPSKPSTSKQENSGFSDVYDEVNAADDRSADDVPDTPEAQSKNNDTERASPDSDSESERQSADSSGESDAPEDADFAAVEVPDTADDATETLVRPDARAARADAVQADDVVPVSNESAAKTLAANSITQGQAEVAKTAPVQETPPKAPESQVATQSAAALDVDTPEDLDPMRVEVRAKSSGAVQAAPQQAATTQATQAAVVAEVAGAEVGRRNTTEVSSDPVEEMAAPKTEQPATPTISTTQQLQARAIMEQVQNGGQPILTKAADVQASQPMDVMVSTVEDTNANTRGLMSAQEAASQARLNSSAPNPAYIARQMADAVRISDKNLIELAMDPPELGKVRMSLAETSGVMTVTIAAENQATTELMRRHIDMLRKDFMELGYENVAFSFEQNGSESSQQQTQSDDGFGSGAGSGQGQNDGALLGELASLNAQQGRAQTVPDSGLDIRL